jgi:protein-tyrosine phosphatase
MRAWTPEGMPIAVSSAGVRADVGSPMDPRSAEALRGLGGDPADFRARRLTEPLAQDADLVLAMTRDHRTSVLKHNPRGLRRTFTLLEAASLLPLADVDGLPPRPSPERARELGLRLDAARRLHFSSRADDMPDPIGLSARAHRQIGERIAEALHPLVEALLATRIGATGAPAGEAQPEPAALQKL